MRKDFKPETDNIFKQPFYLTDGGLESTLVFHRGIELNHFAAFELLNDVKGRNELIRYFVPYMDLAIEYNVPFVAETPTWRANPDWATKLGYSLEELDMINRHSVSFLRNLVQNHPIGLKRSLISGCIGPRGDGYKVENAMSIDLAKSYHGNQIESFAKAEADLVSAFTLNYSNEAIGIAMAAKELNIPVVISFTLETDGRLPSGETLKDLINQVDDVTDGYVAHYMINCAHPEHFKHIFTGHESWIQRIGAIRANASLKSHAELDESTSLDRGDVSLLADGYSDLSNKLPNLKVIGGCCGTDLTHIATICENLFSEKAEECI